MKILYYFRNLGTAMYMWQIYHIVNELAHYDVKVDILNPTDYTSIEAANEALLNKVKESKYDMFMTCHNEELLYVETLEAIRNRGIPSLLFCPDNLVAPFNHRKIAPHFDLVWLTSKETEYLFAKWNCNTIFLPYAANPFFLTPDFDQTEIPCVGFIGTPHGSRIDRINKMINGGVPMCVHTKQDAFETKMVNAPLKSYYKVLQDSLRYPIGLKLVYSACIDKFKHRHLIEDSPYLHREPPVPLEQLGRKNSEYALMLAFSEANSSGVLKKPVPIVNLRNFEIPMSGGLQITRYTEELAAYFEDNKEIILCKDDEEFRDKAMFYLNPHNDTLRKEMKIAARARAEKEHTWMNRFQKVFDEFNLKI